MGATSLVERTELPNGLRLLFRRAPGVEEELAALAANERKCCSFAKWTLHADADQIALDITAEGEALRIVQAMFAGVGPAR